MTDEVAEMERRQRSEERLAWWGGQYLRSAEESYERARQSLDCREFFTAYLFLYVAFNNLYCLHCFRVQSLERDESKKIRAALKDLSPDELGFYDSEYIKRIQYLNNVICEQFEVGPDRGANQPGIANLRNYFLGKPAPECVEHVDHVASPEEPFDKRLETVQKVASILLCAIRNNQFHAVKGANRPADLRTLEIAYHVLLPIVDSLWGRLDRQPWR